MRRSLVTMPALEELMGGYLHQDWDTYGPDSRAVMKVFAAEWPSLAAQLSDEVERALAEHKSDADMEAFLESLGCQTDAMSPSGSYRIWLTELAAYARDALERQPGGE
jgi:hypothetical protein